jgi:hypothetical protein
MWLERFSYKDFTSPMRLDTKLVTMDASPESSEPG